MTTFRRRTLTIYTGFLTSVLVMANCGAMRTPMGGALTEAEIESMAKRTMPALGIAGPEPELPRVFIDTNYNPPTGRTIPVPAGGDFQAAINQAQPGDIITLKAGATYTGNFTLPAKSGSGWIVIRSSAPDGGLPQPGERITPPFAGALPKIVTPNSGAALEALSGAHHYRFIGLEFALATGVPQVFSLVTLGAKETSLAQMPHDLVFDRVYIHGSPSATLRRGITLNSASTAVIDSHISDCHERGADPTIPNLVPSDIEFRRNHCFKPLTWRIGDPSYAGTSWSVKNLFELKNAQRALVDGNIFENNWTMAQNGFAILFTVRNQDGKAPWSVVQDVTFTNNIVRHSASGFNMHGSDTNAPSMASRRFRIANNLLEDIDGKRWNGGGIAFQINRGPHDLTIENNSVFHTGSVVTVGIKPNQNLVFRNNLFPHNEYGIKGDGAGTGNGTIDTYFSGSVFRKNVMVGGPSADYPPDNFFPPSFDQVIFVNRAAGDYRLAPASPYKNAGTDHKDIGCDLDALDAAISGAREKVKVRE